MNRVYSIISVFSLTLLMTLCSGENEKEDMRSAGKTDEHGNRLIKENSPYLLEHAHNPVDWYPWGDEALERAQKEDKPIFLSIGYSACHWCHVMERESFENLEIAGFLNSNFVCIKVDREERPDLDEIYMTAVQLMTGSGGWPLSVFLTPDLKPFFGGTYFPPENRFGITGFMTILERVAAAWGDKKDDILGSSVKLTDAINGMVMDGNGAIDSTMSIDRLALSEMINSFIYEFDQLWGGFGNAPKFPQTALLSLALREYTRLKDENLLKVVKITLDRMAYGGIYDQLGGGFHRYSVDRKWLVPHFEKMLYDNALLSGVYLEAYQVTGDPLYRCVATEVFDFVLDEMIDERGGFHSTLNADSEGEEGIFYVWSQKEVVDVLGEKDSELYCKYYGITKNGNFEGRNILHVETPMKEFAESHGLSESDLRRNIDILSAKLKERRSTRVRPSKDDKVLAAWNGLMVSELAKGYRVLGEKKYLNGAVRAGDFILSNMVVNGRLQHTFRHGECKTDGYLDDFASVANAMLDLYEATFDVKWLDAADGFAGMMISLFMDQKDGGGYFYTSKYHKNLIVRTKPYNDGSIISGNAMASGVMLRLSRLLDRKDYYKEAENIILWSVPAMKRHPMGMAYMLKSADIYLGPSREVVLIGPGSSDKTMEMLKLIQGTYAPDTIVVYRDTEKAIEGDLAHRIPVLAGRESRDGEATVYVCENYSCRKPMTDITELARILRY